MQTRIIYLRADVSEIPATINQTQATQKATDWAIRFYDDLFSKPKALRSRSICHYPAHGRAALDQSRSRYEGVAPTTARSIVSHAEATDVPDQGASLRGNYSPNGEGIVVALCRH
jgi:hypothetical protein